MNIKDEKHTTKNTTIMLVVVSHVFLLTTVPMSIYANGDHLWPTESPDPYIAATSLMAYAILYHLMLLNNSINFLLYIAVGRVYRKRLVELFSCKRCFQSEGTLNSTMSDAHSTVTEKTKL